MAAKEKKTKDRFIWKKGDVKVIKKVKAESATPKEATK
jgi:hypothetical protein